MYCMGFSTRRASRSASLGTGLYRRGFLQRTLAAVLSPAAKKCGFKDKGYICYEEDAQESVVLRELLDKKLWNIPDRIKDKGQFEENLNQSIRQYNPEYWRARQSGRKAAEAARSTAPAKEAAR